MKKWHTDRINIFLKMMKSMVSYSHLFRVKQWSCSLAWKSLAVANRIFTSTTVCTKSILAYNTLLSGFSLYLPSDCQILKFILNTLHLSGSNPMLEYFQKRQWENVQHVVAFSLLFSLFSSSFYGCQNRAHYSYDGSGGGDICNAETWFFNLDQKRIYERMNPLPVLYLKIPWTRKLNMKLSSPWELWVG